MTPATLLAAFKRDLEIARREMEYLKIRDVDRYVKRCVQQARANLAELTGKVESSGVEGQWVLCGRLSRKADEISDLMTYAVIASWDIQQSTKVDQDEALFAVLKKQFAAKGSFTDYLLERMDQSLDLCRRLEAAGFEDIAP